MSASPREIMKNWPVYRVAVQETESSEVVIRNIRAETLDKTLELLRRIVGVDDLSKCSFFEVHELLSNGQLKVVIGDVNKPWPKTTQRNVDGIISPKPDTSDIIDRTAQRIEDMISEFRSNSKKSPEDEELGRPVQTYKRGVA